MNIPLKGKVNWWQVAMTLLVTIASWLAGLFLIAREIDHRVLLQDERQAVAARQFDERVRVVDRTLERHDARLEQLENLTSRNDEKLRLLIEQTAEIREDTRALRRAISQAYPAR